MDSVRLASQADGVCGHRKEEENVTAFSPSASPSRMAVCALQQQQQQQQQQISTSQRKQDSQQSGKDFSDCSCAQRQSLHRSSSDSSVDSGVTAGESTDVLRHSQRLRRIADERISPEKRPTGKNLQEAIHGEATGTAGCSTAVTLSPRDESTQPRRPDFLQLLNTSTSSPSPPCTQSIQNNTEAVEHRLQQLSPDISSLASAVPKDSKKGVPDFSLSTTKHRSLRRRKQAIDESLVWIRKQLETIEWQNQDMICMLLRNIKELRDFKHTMTPISGTTTDSGLLHHGRFNSFRGESRFQRPAGAVYRPRLQTLS